MSWRLHTMDYDSTMARVALIHPTRRNFTITVLSERNRHKRSYCVIFFPSCGKEAQWNWLYAGIVWRPNLNPVGTSAGREKVVPGRGGKELKGSCGGLCFFARVVVTQVRSLCHNSLRGLFTFQVLSVSMSHFTIKKGQINFKRFGKASLSQP